MHPKNAVVIITHMKTISEVVLLNSCKLKPSEDVRIPITQHILHQICDLA